jgi:inosine-uridine nucleoside N-ribohydrolase
LSEYQERLSQETVTLAQTPSSFPEKTPIILDTDIGTDIDDTWALAMLLRSPELDVKLIVTDTGDTRCRARIVAKMLEIGGQKEVPIGIGIPLESGVDIPSHQAPWVEGYSLSTYPGQVYENGVGAIVETIMGSAEPITLICIGPVPNISAALEREPRIAKRARFVGMHGSIRRGYGGSKDISTEYNVARYPRACQQVFTAPWDIIITPLDTCGLVRLTEKKYQAILSSKAPLTQAIIENYWIWAANAKWASGLDVEAESSTLFDTVAIYLAFSKELLMVEQLGIRVTDDGYTVIDEYAKAINCAVGWKDLSAFEDLLVRRLT